MELPVERWTSSPWGFRRLGVEEYFATIARLGLRNVCVMLGGEPAALSPGAPPEELDRLLSLARANGLRIVELAGGGDYTRPDGVEEEVEKTLRHIDMARRLGAGILRVFAGWIAEDEATSRTYGQVSEALRAIGERAARAGIVVAVENHGGVTRTVEQTRRILDAVPLDAVGLNYDPANYAIHGEDPLAVLDVLPERIVFTHLKSVRTGPEGGREYCRVREGDIDYRRLFERLLPRYEGLLGLEYEDPRDPVEGTLDDWEALRQAAREVKVTGGQGA